MPLDTNPLRFYGRNIIEDYHAKLRARLPSGVGPPDSVDVLDDQIPSPAETKVGILGAGIGGLYAALILDSLDIEYDILEASDRTGGRMCTYKFPGGGTYDYYDTGAMRFPFPKKDRQGRYKDGVMKRLAELTEYGPLNEGEHRLKDSLIPFYFETQEGSKPGHYYLNGIREPMSNVPKGSFGAEEMGVDADYIRAGADAIFGDIVQPFVRMLTQDIETGNRKGWDVLMANDAYSLRAYQSSKYLPSADLRLPPQHLPLNVINWCELLSGFSGANSLVDSVLLVLAFTNIGNTDYGDIQWKCFEGGSETLPKKIEEYLNRKRSCIRFNKTVTAISQGTIAVKTLTSSSDHGSPRSEELDDFVDLGAEDMSTNVEIPSVTVTVNEDEKYHYAHVISTLPLPVLRSVDLSDAGLTTMQRNALRALGYMPATKIAILFQSNWWSTKLGIVGGQTITDLPIGMIVYPSHGVRSATPSRVLIASYSVAVHADRLGALATADDGGALRARVLRDLAEAHRGLHPEVTYEYLQAQFVDMHVKDWNRDARAMGAFAHFGPGDFRALYAALTFPAARRRLHFAGEATSTHHAWVVGALDSAWRAVRAYLKVTRQRDKMRAFERLWGEDGEWGGGSLSAGGVGGGSGRDLMDEHLGLVDLALRSGVSP